MRIRKLIEEFEKNSRVYESSVLRFEGVDGYDVYNTSVPFRYEGRLYLFGRVERRKEWARSTVRLFTCRNKNVWELAEDSMLYQMEDPFVMELQGEIVLGGTRVDYSRGKLSGFCGVFYKGKDPKELFYYTTGPRDMKDIRLVRMEDDRIGVFSRPRGEQIRQRYGSESVIGFTIIDGIEQLDADTVAGAEVIPDVFETDEWGGCNQCLLLEDGRIGVIGHRCCYEEEHGQVQQIYVNIAFVFDPDIRKVSDMKVIGTRSSYPPGQAKRADLENCAFTSGICRRSDGRFDLYSGIGDTTEGRIVIDNPFPVEIRTTEWSEE